MLKALCTLLLLSICLTSSANGQSCDKSNFWSIVQSETGKQVQKKPEWNITITNNCGCAVYDIELNCEGFKTVEEIPPTTLEVNGEKCLFKHVFYGKDSASFTYAWDAQYPFTPTDANSCSN